MKTMKNILKCKLVYLFILTLAATNVRAESEVSKLIKKSVALPDKVEVYMNNYNSDLTIHTDEKGQARLETMVIVEGETSQDTKTFLDAVDDIEFKLEGNKLKIDTKFWESSYTVSLVNSKTTIKLKNGEKVKVSNYKLSHTLYLPKSSSLNLFDKYSKTTIDDLDGEMHLNIYNGKTEVGAIAKNTSVQLKYTQAKFTTMQDAIFDLYDSDVVLKEAGNMSATSKYSTLKADKAGDVKINSYDDKFYFTKGKSFIITAKYSYFNLPSGLSKLEFSSYDSNLTAGDAESVLYSGKYSELTLGKVGDMKLSSTYNDKFSIAELGSFECAEEKYTSFEIGNLKKMFKCNGYDTKVTVKNVDPSFENIYYNGKYGDLNFTMGNNSKYRLSVDCKYAKVVYPGTMEFTHKIIEGNNTMMKGSINGITDSDKGLVELFGYDNKLKL